MNAQEWRAVLGLGALYALRMIGMFMILPVFQPFAAGLPGGDRPWLVGLAMGIYGLTNALLQIPLGIASDRYGRKPVIYLGMAVFALGSVIAGAADSIGWILVGRALQGAGAVSSAVAALLADVTRESVRTTAMAILGAGMGLSFILALVTGPIVSGWIGVSGIFYLTAVLALLSLPVVFFGVPTPELPSVRAGGFRAVLTDGQLLRFDAGIFLLHGTMYALFLGAPLAIVQTLGLPAERHWQVYLPVLLLSIVPVFPLIRWAEGRGHAKAVFLAAIAVLSCALGLAALLHRSPGGLLGALLLFFVAFNYLEGALPSMISRRAPSAHKGAALGVYSSAQFLGAFAGGTVGGVALQHGGIPGVFAAAALLPLIWLGLALRVQIPQPVAPPLDAGARNG
ncbi:Predicted arabinose efflux permease, MFS family [Fontimonas thermophila]|uniref:Predicted arabinose efflux permease, MFS family n=1 Tax=Fontimonas thermophila TaxID=1076937 RepID=A0A1I2JWK3_9GAMM|nr:MFS transporter [Fontimonas thermophila]SFF58569.1 Predicted arabinose efflux permease, MFS family [Fontimonas thermophila]